MERNAFQPGPWRGGFRAPRFAGRGWGSSAVAPTPGAPLRGASFAGADYYEGGSDYDVDSATDSEDTSEQQLKMNEECVRRYDDWLKRARAEAGPAGPPAEASAPRLSDTGDPEGSTASRHCEEAASPCQSGEVQTA